MDAVIMQNDVGNTITVIPGKVEEPHVLIVHTHQLQEEGSLDEEEYGR